VFLVCFYWQVPIYFASSEANRASERKGLVGLFRRPLFNVRLESTSLFKLTRADCNIYSRALVNLTNDFIQPVPEHKKKIQLIPSAVICHIDESTLFGNNVKHFY
jgi:hypothetical protein